MITKKKILLGISGSIAAYKTPDLVRKLIEAGYEINIVLTKAGSAFVTRFTLQAVSGGIVYEELFEPQSQLAMDHIQLARWADLILIAPASAHVLAKLAHGLADDLLTTLCLATSAPLVIVPAMNQRMWQHAAVQANLALLKQRGAIFIGPAEGLQACGDDGPGRMVEPIDIVPAIQSCFSAPYLRGKRVLITAGPTQEAIDPVRYISNRSSGKMGYALAEAAQTAGAEVTLISDPSTISVPYGVKVIAVKTAAEMLAAVEDNLVGQDLFIAAAAVADYHLKNPVAKKIKHTSGNLTLVLEPTVDILAKVCAGKHQLITVGFAAETKDVEHYAKQKLQQKGADYIIANDVSRVDIGFDSDDNAVSIISANEIITLEKMPKKILAHKILSMVSAKLVSDIKSTFN